MEDDFPSKNWVIFRFQPLIFPVVSPLFSDSFFFQIPFLCSWLRDRSPWTNMGQRLRPASFLGFTVGSVSRELTTMTSRPCFARRVWRLPKWWFTVGYVIHSFLEGSPVFNSLSNVPVFWQDPPKTKRYVGIQYKVYYLYIHVYKDILYIYIYIYI